MEANMEIVVRNREEKEDLKVTAPHPAENGYLNYGRCPICGDLHALNENGDQCGKG
jgi:hypothetical protein